MERANRRLSGGYFGGYTTGRHRSTIRSDKQSRRTASRLLAGSVAVGIASAMLFGSHPAKASNLYWDTTTAGATWGTAANWSTTFNLTTASTASPGSSDMAIFSILGLGATTANLDADQSALGLYFNDSNTTALVGSGANRTLSLGSSGIADIVGTGAVTIGSATAGQNVNLSLAANQSWANYSNALLSFVNGISSTSNGGATTTLTIGNFIGTGADTFSGVISDGTGKTALTIASPTAASITLANANTYSGNTSVQAGTLLLDFSVGTSPTSGIIGSSSALVLGGGEPIRSDANQAASNSYFPTLSLKGKGSATNSQTFASTTLNQGLSVITLSQNSATSLTAGLASITRNSGAILNFSNAPSTSGIIATTSNSNDASGILGSWATNNSGANLQYVTVNGSHQIVNYTGATADSGNLAGLTSATTNYSSSAASTLTGPATGNTLRYTGAANAIALAGNTLTLNGLMNAGTGTLTISTTAGGSLVTGSNNELVITGNTQLMVISAPITGTGAVTIATTNGSGSSNGLSDAVTLSGASTYTGTTYLSSGEVNIGATAATGGSNTYGNTGAGTGPLGNGGAITFSGGALGFNGSATWGNAAGAPTTGDIAGRIKNSTGPISFDLNGAYNLVLNGAIDSSNTGGLIVNSRFSAYSALTLNGANSYSGRNILVGNAVSYFLGSKSAFGTGDVIGSWGMIYANTDLTGANAIANNFYANGGGFLFAGTHSIELSGTVGQYIGQGGRFLGNFIRSGSLILSGTLAQTDSTNTASGGLNLYVGLNSTTNVTGVIAAGVPATNNPNFGVFFWGPGTVNLQNTNTSPGQMIEKNGVTLNLDFSAATAPLSNILPGGAAGGANANQFQVWGGSTLELTGKPGAANTQALNNLLSYPGSNKLVMNQNGASSLTLNVNNFTTNASPSNNAGTYLDITMGANSSIVASNAVSGNTIYPWSTVNQNDWATSSGAGPYNVVAYTGYSDTADVSAWTTGQDITNSATSGAFTNGLSAPLTINTLRYNDNVAGGPNLNGQTLTITSGILVTTNVSGQALTLGTNTDTLQGGAGGRQLLIINNGTNGTSLTIGANIQDNGGNSTALTKAGAGVVNLTGNNNTYSGLTYIDGGLLTGNISDNSAIQFNGGVLGVSSDFTRAIGTSFGLVNFGSINSTGGGGFAAMVPGTVHVNLNGNGTLDTATQLGGHGTTLTLGDATASGMIDFQNALTLEYGFTLNVVKGTNAASPTPVITGVGDALAGTFIDAKLSGVVATQGSQGGIGLTKTGNGTLWLSNAGNTFNGPLTILAGVVTLQGDGTSIGKIAANVTNVVVDGPTAELDLGTAAVLDESNANAPVVLDHGGTIIGTNGINSKAFDLRSGTITAPLGGTGGIVSKSTSGTVTLSGINTYTGNTNVTGGTLEIGPGGNLASGNNLTVNATSMAASAKFDARTATGIVPVTLGNVNLVAGGTLALASNTSASPTDAPGAATNHSNRMVLVASSLTNTGNIDLGGNDLIIKNGAAGLSSIIAQLANGFNSGSGYWKGTANGSIRSSAAASDSTHLTTIGVIQNLASDNVSTVYTSFDGVSGLTTTDVLVKYTYYGDADLSGSVTGQDYNLIDTNNGLTSGATWGQGDFNYDGKVDGSDYSLIDNAFNQQGSGGLANPLSIIATNTSEVAGLSTSSVPEPGSLTLIAMGAATLFGRRRRK